MNTLPAEQKLVSLVGHVEVTVTSSDGASAETVKVRQLPIKLLPKYADAQNDEPKMAELLTGKPDGWADTIKDESIEAIVIAGEAINADFFGRWVKRRMDRLERIQPGAVGKAMEIAAKSA